MQNSNIIQLKNVCKNYRMGEETIKAVCNIDLEIKKGDFLAIVGPSGSGKSTMMNLVGALDLASEGDIFLDNQNIEHLEESELAKIRGKKIGFVFQTFNLIPTLTALENVMLPMIFQNVPSEERRERAEKEGQETFSVQTAAGLLETFTNIFAVVQAVFVGIAAISLLVGGIGIMNTMYTAVLERTKEIGTMKAVGAKNSDIFWIFSIESGLLGLVGGAIGIILGIGIGKGVEYFATIYLGSPLVQAVFGWQLILGALLFSFIVGSFSGLLPALQASKMNPVDALRYE